MCVCVCIWIICGAYIKRHNKNPSEYISTAVDTYNEPVVEFPRIW